MDQLARDGNGLTADWLALQRSAPASASGVLEALGRSDLLRIAYGGRYLTRPIFLERDEWSALGADLGAFHELSCSLPDRLCGGDVAEFGRLVGMAPVQVDAVRRTMGERPLPCARADLYREPDGFKILEFNIVSALGGFENAELNRAALDEPALAKFVADRDLGYADTLAGIVDVIFDAFRDADLPSRPRMAVVDWPSSFVDLEPRLRNMCDLLRPLGIDAVACHPGQVRAVGDRLEVHGQPIDIVYRFFLIEDLLDGPDAPALVEPILRAVERGTVRMFAPLDSELVGNKRALSLMTEPEHRDRLTEDERALVDRLVPWTRRLDGATVERDGEEHDAVTYLLDHQPDLLLKPSLLHGGLGVTPGWTVTPDDWADAVSAAVETGGFVVQERVRPEREPFLTGEGDQVDMSLNWGVFVLGGGYGGAIVRGTADPDVGVVSMANGARVGCCFHAP